MVKILPVMPETWVQSLGWKDPLEESVVTHSSILAWRIPWTEEPGGLQSTGSHTVGCNWSDLAAAAAALIQTGSLWYKKHPNENRDSLKILHVSGKTQSTYLTRSLASSLHEGFFYIPSKPHSRTLVQLSFWSNSVFFLENTFSNKWIC